MNIRPATEEDLPLCAQLDGAYESDYVWQMDAHTSATENRMAFRTMRLPRTVQVPYKLDPRVLAWDWQHEECFLVAAEEEEDQEEILGFLDMRIQPWERMGWAYHLVVDRKHRRRRIGASLLRTGIAWARQEGLRSVTVEVSTKNHPAIEFCQRSGFIFCGYNDLYFASRDIALFFSRHV